VHELATLRLCENQNFRIEIRALIQRDVFGAKDTRKSLLPAGDGDMSLRGYPSPPWGLISRMITSFAMRERDPPAFPLRQKHFKHLTAHVVHRHAPLCPVMQAFPFLWGGGKPKTAIKNQRTKRP
jgi:hypothetical protein